METSRKTWGNQKQSSCHFKIPVSFTKSHWWWDLKTGFARLKTNKKPGHKMLCKSIDIPVFPAKLCLRNIDSWFSQGWKGGPVRGLRAHPCLLPPEMLSWVMTLGEKKMNKEHCLSLGFSRAKRSIFFLWSECDKSWGFSLFFSLNAVRVENQGLHSLRGGQSSK